MTRHDVIELLVELGLIKRPNNKRRIFVQLGKNGDIINILPALRVASQQCGEPVRLMVADQFKEVVTGLYYVEPEIFQGEWFAGLTEAIAMAKAKYDEVVVTQVSGKNYSFTRCEQHFNMESWRLSGMGAHYYNAKLVLDNRDFEREVTLAGFLAWDKPNVLINLSGASSPLHTGPTLLEWFRTALPDVHFVDIGAVKAERITDLLGLYDRAVCLITCDTATLHLARSHPIPVVAMCAEGWNGSHSVANVVFKCTYLHVWHHLETIRHIIKCCVRKPVTHPRLLLLWQDYGKANNREVQADQSWSDGSVVKLVFKPGDYPTALNVGDTVDTPDIKAVLDKAITDNPRDIVIFSNSDICMLPNTPLEIRKGVNRYGCFYSHRIDVENVVLPLTVKPDGVVYPGADVFAFSHDWWKENRDAVPSLFMGFEGWDFVAKALMRRSGFVPGEPCIVHQKHEESKWKFQNQRPAQIHNRETCIEWAKKHGFESYVIDGGLGPFLFKNL